MMNEETEFDVEDFQKKVFDEYVLLKNFKKWEKFSSDDLKKPFEKNMSGCLFIPLITLFKPLGKKAVKNAIGKYREFYSEAKDLLAEDKIRDAICKSFEKVSRKEILTEEKLVSKVSDALAEKNLRKQFVIPLKPVLFAVIAYEILETGIENFCGEVNEEN